MLTIPRKPSPPPRTELETVTHWPLFLATCGLQLLLLAVPLTLAFIAALKAGPEKDRATAAPASAKRKVAAVAAVSPPREPIASYANPPAKGYRPVYTSPPQREEKPRPRKPVASASASTPPKVSPATATAEQVTSVPAVNTPTPAALSFKRRSNLLPDVLFEDLQKQVKELDLEDGMMSVKIPGPARQGKGTKRRVPPTPNKRTMAQTFVESHLDLLVQREDLKGLPFRRGDACRIGPEKARTMAALSSAFRQFPREQLSPWYRQQRLFQILLERKGDMHADSLFTVFQLLEVEDVTVRLHLSRFLSEFANPVATALLAKQALFDLAPEVREEAVGFLANRAHEDYRPLLLKGLRYPWAPVADHAAEALAALNDRGAVPALVALLDEPNPCEPVQDSGTKKWVVSEVVRVNHLRNCMLCHAPSLDRYDPVRGAVPTPGEPLPRVYYDDPHGTFVRADVTYLRQDFSLLQRVCKPDESWPDFQRYDYIVRSRELTAQELADRQDRTGPPAFVSYPQREAVLFALRALTGMNPGETTAHWREALAQLESPFHPRR